MLEEKETYKYWGILEADTYETTHTPGLAGFAVLLVVSTLLFLLTPGRLSLSMVVQKSLGNKQQTEGGRRTANVEW